MYPFGDTAVLQDSRLPRDEEIRRAHEVLVRDILRSTHLSGIYTEIVLFSCEYGYINLWQIQRELIKASSNVDFQAISVMSPSFRSVPGHGLWVPDGMSARYALNVATISQPRQLGAAPSDRLRDGCGIWIGSDMKDRIPEPELVFESYVPNLGVGQIASEPAIPEPSQTATQKQFSFI